MKPQIATTIDQSQCLIACGVNPDSADMAWKEDLTSIRLEVLNHPWIENLQNLHYSPAWSLSALLELMPSPIYDEHRKQFTFRLLPTCGNKAWVCEYDGHSTCLYQSNGAESIEAVVRMIETLMFHGYTLNTK